MNRPGSVVCTEGRESTPSEILVGKRRCSAAKERLMTDYFRDPHVVSLRYRVEMAKIVLLYRTNLSPSVKTRPWHVRANRLPKLP